MKARVARYDAHYEVAFHRPAFSRITSFSQIVEPIYDAFSAEVQIPPDAIKLENGNTIATAGVTLTLFSGFGLFEARLDGYKAHFLDLQSSEAIDQARRYAKLFESAVCGFLADGIPVYWKLIIPSWLTVDGGMDATEGLIRGLTWLPESHDPFEIGSTKVSSQVSFDCFNKEDLCTVRVTVDKSAMQGTHLFLEISSEYEDGSPFNTLDKQAEHLSIVRDSVVNKLGLEGD